MREYLAALDGAVLGTALVYQKHATGVYRVLKELLTEMKNNPEVQLEFLSFGRAKWLEFPTRLAFELNWSRTGWVFRPRRARFPGTYRLLLAIARVLLVARSRGIFSERMTAGGMQILGLGLCNNLASFSSKVYWSPAHALPPVPDGVIRCLTLYDMIPAKFPQWYNETKSFHTILKSIDRERDRLLTISESTRRDWLEYSNAPEKLTLSIPIGVSNLFYPPSHDDAECSRVRAKYGMNSMRFLLAVGTLEPRKNIETLVRAFISLREEERFRDLQLVVVGPKGWKNGGLFELLRSRPHATDSIHLAGFVPDQDLPGLYAACEVFIYPSLYEGFGLPVAEALKCGAAVVCGNHSSLPEVAGDAAAYADVHDPNAIAVAIADLMDNTSKRENLRLKALALGDRFNWSYTAKAYLAVFSELASVVNEGERETRARSSITT